MHRDVAAACVQTHSNAMVGGEFLDEAGILDRSGANHDSGDAAVKQRLGRFSAPHSPAGLHWHVHGLCNGRDNWPVQRFACACRIQIDHVDPGCTLSGKSSGLCDGVVAVDGLAVIVTLVQPDAAPVTEIDGRKQLKGLSAGCRHDSTVSSDGLLTCATKLLSSSSPDAPDFSG